MHPIIRIAAALLAANSLAHKSLAIEAAIAVPVDCKAFFGMSDAEFRDAFYLGDRSLPPSCGSDVNLEKARQSRSKSSNQNRRLITTPQKLNRLCGERPSIYTWARVEELEDGRDRLVFLVNSAKSGELSKGQQVVEAMPVVRGEQHLALCVVSEGGGPPRECNTVAILTENETWLRGEEDRSGGPIPRDVECPAAGSIRLSGSISIDWAIESKKDLKSFTDSLVSDLTKKQDLKPKIKELKEQSGKDLHSAHRNICSTKEFQNPFRRVARIVRF